MRKKIRVIENGKIIEENGKKIKKIKLSLEINSSIAENLMRKVENDMLESKKH